MCKIYLPTNHPQGTKTLWSKCGALMIVSIVLTAVEGCGSGILKQTSPATEAVAPSQLRGTVHGGKQAVVGASIQLFAASTSGYGEPATPLLHSPVQSDGSGSFSIGGDYSCPSSSTLVYLVSSGGDTGSGVNPNAAMMVALGACGTLSASTYINVNEVSTVAAAYALAPFLASRTNLGTSASNVQGLTNAFALAHRLAAVDSGQTPGVLPAGASLSVAKINTLADILAACIDSTGGTLGDKNPCGILFSLTALPGSRIPVDTIDAIGLIARNPWHNVKAALALMPANSPYQPMLADTSDFTIAIRYKPSVSKPAAAAVDADGNLWVANAGNNTLSVVDASGQPIQGSPFSTGNLSDPSAIAIDLKGNAWVTNKGSSSLSVFTPAGVGSNFTSTSLSVPTGAAVDAQGIVWITNSGNNSVSTFTMTGSTFQHTADYITGGINTPTAIAVSPH